jgi:uncharacterized delta-60 repeat protein
MKKWLILCLFSQTHSIFAQYTMVLDSTFDQDGLVFTDAVSTDESIYALAVQPDGKIIASGTAVLASVIIPTVGYDFCTVRYNPNGSIDQTFGNNGVVVTDVAGYYDGTNDVIVQPDGKILLTGQGQDSIGETRYCCIRYNSDGSYDNTFGNNGISMPLNLISTAQCISLQSDHKILLGGGVNVSSNQNFFLARLNVNGSVDTSFGNAGTFEYDINNEECYITSMVIQPDHKIVVSGRHLDGSNYNKFIVMRLDSNGVLDNSFGINGVATTDVGNGIPLEVQLNFFGDILVSGTSGTFGSNEYMCLVKYKSNGSLDTSFSNDGMAFTQVECSSDAFALTIRAGNKYLVSGVTTDCLTPGFAEFALAQYNSNGDLDTSFDSDGKYSYQNTWGIGRTFATDAFGAVYFGGNDYGANGSDYMILKLKGKSHSISIEENELSSHFNIYPNPVEDLFTIEAINNSQIENIELMDITGKTIRKILINSTNQFVHIGDISTGVYFIKICASNGSTIKKIVKK